MNSSEITKPKVDSEGCCHSRRTFFYVQESEIPPERSRSGRINAKAVSQIRKLHAIKPSMESKFGVSKRLLSWFCRFCIGLEGDHSSKATHVDDWEPEGQKCPKIKRGSEAHVTLCSDQKGPKVKGGSEAQVTLEKDQKVPEVKRGTEAHVTEGKDQIEENERVGDLNR